MTDQEKIAKLEQIIEESFVAFKMLPKLDVCNFCKDVNNKIVEDIINKIEIAIKLKKEII
jgi:hypothetical protein